jgi:predicted RecB family endonuclease
MMSSSTETLALQAATELESTLSEVEQYLSALGTALKLQDATATEVAATELHRALAEAVQRFGQAARTGGVPPALRRRLARTSGQVAAQRDAVARATNALDRALDVLIPTPEPAVYGASAHRISSSGLAQA